MALYGSGRSYAANGASALWTAPFVFFRDGIGDVTTLFWVRDTAYSGTFANGVLGGLAGLASLSCLTTTMNGGNAVGVAQPNTGTIPPPVGATFSASASSWVPLVTQFQKATPYVQVFTSPYSGTFGIQRSGTLSGGFIFLGDFNLSKSSLPSSSPLATTTLVGEFALWRGLLATQDMAPLFFGANPLQVRPDLLFAYYPLNGDLLDRGPMGRGLKGPSPNFGPHPPVEPIRSRHRISTLRHVGAKDAAGASGSGSKADSRATAARATAGKAQASSFASAQVARLARAISEAASLASAKAAVTRKALGRSVSASVAAAKMAGPRSSKAASADASGVSASVTAARSASARANAPSTAKAAFKASRVGSGAASGGSTGNAAVGFIRNGGASAVSGSVAALKANAGYAVRGVSRAASTVAAAVTPTFVATSKQATGKSIDASAAVAAFVASRVASGAASTASKAAAGAAWALKGSSASGSATQGVANVRRPARGSASSGVLASALATVVRSALGVSADGSAANASAGGPRAAQGAALGAVAAAAQAVSSRSAAGEAVAGSDATAKAGHGFAVRGAAVTGSAALAKMQRNMRGRSVSAAWATAVALAKRQIGGLSVSAGSASAAATHSLPKSGEIGPLLSIDTITTLRVFLSWRTAAFRIGPDGAVGGNGSGFVDVGLQGEAIWSLLFDIINAQPSATSVQAALDYGFAQQAGDGSFLIPTGVGSRHDIEASFSFLQFAARAVLLSQSAGAQFAVTVDQAALAKALAWYSADVQIASLQLADQRSGSALMAAASAFLLGSLVLGDTALEATGRSVMARALALQNQAGWFNERNAQGQEGFDAVYQGIIVHQFAVLCAYFPQELGWATALRSAVTWLKGKIYPDVPSQGWLNVNGSVRSNGQDAPLVNGEPPQLDIADAGFGLLLAGEILSDAAATALGAKVLALYDATRSAHDVIVRP